MSAASGDVEAINRILKHYEGYIAVLSTRKLYDEYGNLHYCILRLDSATFSEIQST